MPHLPHLGLTLPVSRAVSKVFLLLVSLSVYGILFQQPEISEVLLQACICAQAVLQSVLFPTVFMDDV